MGISVEDRFRLLVQSVVDYAIYMLDTDGYVTSWNAGARRIKGFQAEEIVGKHFSTFYTPEDRAAGVPQQVLDTARREGKYEGEGWRLRKDGTRFWASVVVDAIKDDHGDLVGFAKITRDMTDKREAQLRLDELREQLYRAQKMEALGQLTGGLSHDFNNLLTAILGAADLALRQPADPNKLKRLLEGIRSSAQRGASLTKQLLAFARAQPLRIEPVQIRDFISDVVTLLRPSLRSNIELVIETPDRLWTAGADPGALELALLNLTFNARDAMKEGGTLKLSAANVTLNGGPDGLTGDYVALRVSDTGTGIAPDAIDRVFEPFFTTKSFGEGTGLGLSQVFGFVKQLGGTVTVESTVGQGSTFTLYLPVSRGGLESEVTGNGRAAGGLVLVAEDDEIVAELAASLLSELGFSAVTVRSSREALDHLTKGERPRLLFADIIMPGGTSGLELARSVRQRLPELPVLLTTGYSEQATSNHGFHVLPKPYDLDSLAKAVSEVLQTDVSAASMEPATPA